MPWNNNTGLMTAPININAGGDIQQAVNWNSGDLGQCITKGTINKWSKCKPVPYPSFVGPDSEYDGQRSGVFLIHGMIVPNAASIGTMSYSGKVSTVTKGFLFDLIKGKLAWDYQRPAGGSAEPFRMLDFVGYTSKAYNPLPTAPDGDRYASATGTLSLKVSVANVRRLYNIALSDLQTSRYGGMPTLNKYYAGIVLYRDAGGGSVYRVHYATATQPLDYSSDDKQYQYIVPLQVDPEATGSAIEWGEWKARAFLANALITPDQREIEAYDFVSCDDEEHTVNLKQTIYGTTVDLYARITNVDGDNVYARITITAGTAGVTISNATLKIESSSHQETYNVTDLNLIMSIGSTVEKTIVSENTYSRLSEAVTVTFTCTATNTTSGEKQTFEQVHRLKKLAAGSVDDPVLTD